MCFDVTSPSHQPRTEPSFQDRTQAVTLDSFGVDIRLNAATAVGSSSVFASGSSLPNGRTNEILAAGPALAEASATLLPIDTVNVLPASIAGSGRGQCNGGASGDAHFNLHPYLIELIRNTVREEVEECEERLRRTVLHLHADMLKQFHLQQVIV